MSATTPTTTSASATTKLTNSSIGTYMECPEKYRIMYVEKIRPAKEADYFRIGGAYHLGQEVYRKKGSLEKALVAIAENYSRPPEWVMQDEERLAKWYYEATTCVCLMRGHVEYYYQYKDGLEAVEVIEAEGVFEVPIRNPATGAPTPRYIRTGKRDGIDRLADNRLALREFKTAGQDINRGADYWWHKKIDSQPSGYFVAAAEEGYKLDTVIYDVARKPTIRPSGVPVLDADGLKQVVDVNGERVRNKDGSWRQSAGKGETILTRRMTCKEWETKLMADIRSRFDFYYVRDEITRLPGDLADYEQDLWNVQKQLANSERLGRWFKNTRSCIGRTTCEFFRICTQRIPVGEGHPEPEGYRRADSAHEELE